MGMYVRWLWGHPPTAALEETTHRRVDHEDHMETSSSGLKAANTKPPSRPTMADEGQTAGSLDYQGQKGRLQAVSSHPLQDFGLYGMGSCWRFWVEEQLDIIRTEKDDLSCGGGIDALGRERREKVDSHHPLIIWARVEVTTGVRIKDWITNVL